MAFNNIETYRLVDGDKINNLPNNTNDSLATKVDKIDWKWLSTNDYSTTEKEKLATIAIGAEVNVNADWNAISGDELILNKPILSTVAISWSYNDLSNKPNIPTKTSDLSNDNLLEDIVAGTNITIDKTNPLRPIINSTASWWSGTWDMLKSTYDTNNNGKVDVAELAEGVAYANVTGKPTFATVATSGSYNDLIDKPTIWAWDMLKSENLSWLANYTTARTNLWVYSTTEVNTALDLKQNLNLTNLSSINLNTIVTNGKYCANANCTNLPETSVKTRLIVNVDPSDANLAMQEALTTTTQVSYIRTTANWWSSWTAWARIKATDETKEPLKWTDDNYVTDAEKVKLSNLSWTNTGDQDLSGLTPKYRTLTINWTTYDLSRDRSWTISWWGWSNLWYNAINSSQSVTTWAMYWVTCSTSNITLTIPNWTNVWDNLSVKKLDNTSFWVILSGNIELDWNYTLWLQYESVDLFWNWTYFLIK